MRPINPDPLKAAAPADLARWRADLARALDAPCPPDVPGWRWAEDRTMVQELLTAIEIELSTRSDTSDNRERPTDERSIA